MNLNKDLHNKILSKLYCHIKTKKEIKPKKAGIRRIYLFGVPEHQNYGDVAIYVAEINFLKKRLPKFEIVAIPERLVESTILDVKAVADTNDIIALHGGGNMGDIWPYPDKLRQDVIKYFGKEHHLISFPQSVSYSDPKWVERIQPLLRSCVDISMFARDNESFITMKKVFPNNVKCILVPDIVLSLNKVTTLSPVNDVLFLMRKDREKLENPDYSLVKNYIEGKYKYKDSDTVDDTWHLINERTAPKRVNQKLKELQNAKLVVTDRLHGMIFSQITGTPALVFDNNNHKIRNFYNTWFKGKTNSILFISGNNQDTMISFIDSAITGNIKFTSINFDYTPLTREFLS